MSTPESLLLAACGDIMLHNRYQALADAGNAAQVFAPLRDRLEDTDLLVGNLETPLTRAGEARDDKLCLRGDPAYAPVLAETGFSVLSLANNHCLDYGNRVLAETRLHLQAAGIAAIGAGADLTEAAMPAIIERRGIRIGLLAACDASTKPAPPATTGDASQPGRPGIVPLTAETLLPAIDALKPQVDHVILLLHWGLEYSPMPTPEQVSLAHRAVEHGASVVLGHHSHCIQGIERYQGGVIAYSLANLTDDGVDWQGPTRRYTAPLTQADRESLLLRLRLDKTSMELLDPIPLWLDDNGCPTPADGEHAQRILAQIEARSDRLRSTEDLKAYWENSVIERRVAAPLLSWWHDGSLWDKVRGFRPGQIVSAWLLLRTYLQVRFSRSESRWMLFNERNDTRPMPAVRERRDDD